MSYISYEFASNKHSDQTRKFTGLPYIVHCSNVASIVKPYSRGQFEIIEVAHLHDTLEDTDTTYNEIISIFGYEVANSVLALTNVPKEAGNRKHRKKLDNERLSKAGYIAQTVKLADIMDNVPSMLLHKPDFGKRYLREKLDTLKVLNNANAKLLNIVGHYLSELKNAQSDK